MKPSYEELEARCAALAAENAGLKSSVAEVRRQAFNARRNSHNCGPFQYSDLCDSIIDETKVETPATDAFLAEVRAAAVDEVCLKISNAIVNCYQDEQVGLDAAATICGDFAAQLRKGVQS
ncbi:hypothetical protein ACOJRE_002463 [Enterobacter hormaechei]|uniref:hypothetical protein n=1 Tax=Enterobacter hormaechei TaxID=158836 RepID=UPI001FF5B8A8|nr:hypothetical protein [Enterobacter hormaechei]MCK0951795.1 hypothetical protein [Enterobacter hormaechei subsp. steigerwaltii]